VIQAETRLDSLYRRVFRRPLGLAFKILERVRHYEYACNFCALVYAQRLEDNLEQGAGI
jgi:hypothetical protein